MEIKNAAAYIRVSTEEQTEYSPDAQLRELHDYAASHNMLICKVYSDEGISGRRAEKRPGFMQMISDAKRKDHPFDIVLVHKFDRFARSREDSIVYKSMLKRAGVEVVSIKEPLTEGAYSGVMEAIYESFAEAYSINLGQEVRKGMTEKALRGEPQTAPPFGYRLENKMFYPDEKEAPIIRQLFERFVSGEGCYTLSNWMNSQGYTTHRGSRFENRTIEYILRNPVYIGMLRWNPKRRSRRNYSDPDIMIVPGKHEPLIDKATFDAAQSIIAENKALHPYHARPSNDRNHWLSGIVRCAACGGTLIWSKPHYLKCNNFARGGCRVSQHITASVLEKAFISRLQNDMLSSEKINCKIIPIKSTEEASVQRLSAELDRLRNKRHRLTDAYLDGAIELHEFKVLQESLDKEILQKQTQLSEAKSNLPHIDSSLLLRSAIERVLKKLTDPNRSVAEKYDAASSIVERCTFDKSQMLLRLTYRLTI